MVLGAAPRIDVCCSFWESFEFTPQTPSDQTIYITRMAERIYILSYNQSGTTQKEYRVTSLYNGWQVEEITCSPTSFVHDRQIHEILKTQKILDPNHYLSLSPVRTMVKVGECMAVCGLLFIALFSGHQIYHRKYSWRVVFMIVPAVLLVISLILMRNSFRKNNAMLNAARLITVVEHGRRDNSSIEDGSLLHNPSKYKKDMQASEL